MPLVSVIIPNYNHAAYLPQRIGSVLAQTVTDTEIILLDDCSTDGSREIINRYAVLDVRIRPVFNTANSGSPFRQWARGLVEAKGEFVWIAESDDWAEPDFLEKLVAALRRHPTAGMAYSQSWRVDAAGRRLGSCRQEYALLPAGFHGGRQLIEAHLAGANLIPNASAVVFRRETAARLDSRFTGFRFAGDWWFWCQLLACAGLVYVDEELNHFRWHPQKVTVAAHRNQTFVIETLRILALLRQSGLISEPTYRNKSKNAAGQLAAAQHDAARALPPAAFRQILWHALRHNRIFLWHLLKRRLR